MSTANTELRGETVVKALYPSEEEEGTQHGINLVGLEGGLLDEEGRGGGDLLMLLL